MQNNHPNDCHKTVSWCPGLQGLQIGIVVSDLQVPGGAERQARLLAAELGRRGLAVRVFIVTRLFRRKPVAELDFSGLNAHRLWQGPMRWSWGRWLSRICIALQLRTARVDLLHSFNLDPRHTLHVPQAGKAAGIRVRVAGVRNQAFVTNAGFRERLRLASQLVAGLTCNSQDTASRLLEYKVVAAHRLHVIENGIATPEPADREQNTPPPPFQALYAGRLKAVKDPLSFVTAAIKLLRAGRPYRFLISGDGDLMRAVLNLIEASGFSSSFTILGMLRPEDIPYSQVRVLVNTSLSEGSSNSILEALAKGTPVVATSVGGSIELLKTKPFASLVEPHDPDGIAAATDYWLTLPYHEWQAASASAAQFVRQRFAIAQMGARHCEFYRWALDQA